MWTKEAHCDSLRTLTRLHSLAIVGHLLTRVQLCRDVGLNSRILSPPPMEEGKVRDLQSTQQGMTRLASHLPSISLSCRNLLTMSDSGTLMSQSSTINSARINTDKSRGNSQWVYQLSRPRRLWYNLNQKEQHLGSAKRNRRNSLLNQPSSLLILGRRSHI